VLVIVPGVSAKTSGRSLWLLPVLPEPPSCSLSSRGVQQKLAVVPVLPDGQAFHQ
jgi:hypothetical protein